jgi:hypothetical protein
VAATAGAGPRATVGAVVTATVGASTPLA